MVPLQKSSRSLHSIALLIIGMLTCAISAQRQTQPGEKEIYAWISHLADPNQRTVAAVNLVRAGRDSARPLGARLLAGWPRISVQEEVQASSVAAQILLDLDSDAIDSFESVARYLQSKRVWMRRPLLLQLLGRLIAFDPRTALKALESLRNEDASSVFDSLEEHAQWAKVAGPYDLIERLDEVYGDWLQRLLALDFISVRALELLGDESVTLSLLEAKLTSLLAMTSPQYSPDLWRRLSGALAGIGSRSPAAASAHVGDLARIDPRRRVVALQALASFDKLTAWAMAAIVARLKDPALMVVREAVTTLGIAIRHTPGCIGALESVTHHSDRQVRLRAQSVLEPLRRTGHLPEVATWWWPDGRIASRGPLRNGIMEGRWIFFWDNGFKRSTGEYRSGAEHGPWLFWHINRQPSVEGSFDQGKRTGKWITWYEKGGPKSEGRYEDGLANGLWTGWHANGNQAWSGVFLADQRHGHWKLWHPDRSLLGEGEYSNGQRIGEWTVRDEYGRTYKREAVIAQLLGESKQR